MSHLAIRNTRRGKVYSDKDRHPGWELFELLKIIISILLTTYRWIKSSLEHLCSDQFHRSTDIAKSGASSEEDEDFVSEKTGIYVVAKGVGLMAAYTGRRAVFAVYPANAEGLVVKSRGPAPLGFEYRRRKGMFLVGYVPQAAGTYKLRVSRFGRRAVGSPFVIRVEDPPPGYLGDFGASLWHERPPPPPLLSGVVDFVTEKMFLSSDGKLLRLKDGVMVPVRDIKPSKSVKPQVKVEKQISETSVKRKAQILNNNNETRTIMELECLENYETTKNQEVDIETDKMYPTRDENVLNLNDGVVVPVRDTKQSKAAEPPLNLEEQICKTSDQQESYETFEQPGIKRVQFQFPKTDEPKNISAKNQVVARIESLLARANRESQQKNPTERYQCVSKALMKELSLSLKILNMLGGGKDIICPSEMISNCLTKQEFVIPEIKVTVDGESELGRADRSEDRFLSNMARRGGKLGWHWGDDAVLSSGACDDDGIRTRVLRASRVSSGATRWVCRKVGMSGLLGLGKEPRLSGVQLLHNVYRTPAEKDLEKSLNNTQTTKTTHHSSLHGIQEKNNLQPHNEISSSLPRSSSSENLKYENNFSAMTSRMHNNKKKIKKLSASFRTLSLPDFNRFYSLSVQGLRKAKSCGDRSFKAMTSSSLSLTLKNIFEKDQDHEKTKEEVMNFKKIKTSKSGTTVVKMSHYVSDYEKRTVPAKNSVGEWKRYWEDMHVKQANEDFGRDCSLDLTGIVDRGKAFFENSSESDCPANGNSANKVKKKERSRKSGDKAMKRAQNEIHSNGIISFGDGEEMFTTPSPVSNKTAFQKAKEIFEGKYDPREGRRSSTTEEFLSSLTKERSETRRNSDSDRFNVNLMISEEMNDKRFNGNELKLNSIREDLRDKRRNFVCGQLNVTVDSREVRNSLHEEIIFQSNDHQENEGSGLLNTLRGFSECLSQRNTRRRSESAVYMKSAADDMRETRTCNFIEQYKRSSLSEIRNSYIRNSNDNIDSLDNFVSRTSNGNTPLNGNTFSEEMLNSSENILNDQLKNGKNFSAISNNVDVPSHIQKPRKSSTKSEYRLSNEDLQEMRRRCDVEISNGFHEIDGLRRARRNSVSERFNVSSLKEDLEDGVTPDHLGAPHRTSAVSCLGAAYDPNYPHAPITRRMTKDCNENMHSGEFILSSNPDFV